VVCLQECCQGIERECISNTLIINGHCLMHETLSLRSFNLKREGEGRGPLVTYLYSLKLLNVI
jgi:hypothetical protein